MSAAPRRFVDLGREGRVAALPLGAPLAPAELARLAAQDTLIAFAPAEAFVHPAFTAHLAAAAAARPDVALFYGDEVELGAGGQAYLKPRLNEALQRSTGYMNLPLAVRARALQRLGFPADPVDMAALFDLTLQALAKGAGVEGVSEVLVAHPGLRPVCSSEVRRARLAAHLAAREPGLEVRPGLTPASLQVRRVLAEPPAVTLVTPTRQSRSRSGEPYLLRLLRSVSETRWPMQRLRVLVGDDQADSAALGDLSRFPFAVERLATPRPAGEPFNYAAKMNRLWRASSGEHLVFVNDDVEVLDPDWLDALVGWTLDAGVGGVGGRLSYPDGRIQHAGMAGGLFGSFAHPWIGWPEASGYGDWALSQREWSAVSGAVFATRRSVLEAVNGFDERFSLEYNDVDLCLRMRLLGFRIVYEPTAHLLHHEKRSRGAAPPPASETARFLYRWEPVIADDPAFPKGLARDDFQVQPEPDPAAWWRRLA